MSLVELIDRLDESIGAGATPAALRAQLSVIREQFEAVEAQLQEAKARIEELEAQEQSQDLSAQHEDFKEDAKKILQLLFKLGRPLSIEYTARTLGLSKSMADYHAQALVDAGMIEPAGSATRVGRTMYAPTYVLTAKGTAYVVENKLA